MKNSRPLKIVTIHAADFGGGAERSVLTLHRSFMAQGHDSRLYVGYCHTDTPQVYAIKHERPFPGCMRLVRWLETVTGLQNLYAPGFRKLIRDLPGDVDIVHLHSLWGSGNYADIGGVAQIAKRFPLVMTLRDEWMLTGHCAYTHRCELWQSGCGQCPDLSIPPAIPRDGTRMNFARKRCVIQSSDLHVTTVSHYLQGRAEQCPITTGKPISTIYNGIDLTVFHPGDKAAARRELGLAQDRFYVLLAGQTVEGIRQGIAQQAAQAVDRLSDPRITTLIVGRSAGLVAASMQGHHETLPFQETPEGMARCYRAADLTLVSSEVETFGRIAAESQACGTPVVTSSAGGLPEVVKHGTGGLVVPNREVDGFVAAVGCLINDPVRLEQMGRDGICWASGNFADDKIAADYLRLYTQLIAARRGWQ